MNRVEKVINYLNENVHERLRIDDITNITYLSPVQLYRVFKKSTGLTPIQYHERLKRKESLNLLQHSEKISDVAFDLGYENYETFSRAFKKIYNFTPSDLLCTVIYYVTDNIWLPIILHSSIDINLGYLSYQVQNLEKTVVTKLHSKR